ncbi:MAG TPA: hypothetical protein VK932_22085 [Kofleriaceae bacterium]|nr:hypothetical protein [Kofleriaceae bacterium]
MTTSSNDDGRDELDDPALGLGSMRAVWISMRDEEPPTAGLAELLAAARVKAEEMRPREPWWRRIAVAMWRPPVLALATVVVLLGGAVVIGARREAFDATPRVEGQQAGGGAAETAKLEQAREPAADTAADTAAPGEAPAPAAAMAEPLDRMEVAGGAAGSAAAVTADVSEGKPAKAPGGSASPAPRPAFRPAPARRGPPAPEVAAPVVGTVAVDRTVAADPPPVTRERVETEAAAPPAATPDGATPSAPPRPPSVPRDVKAPRQRLQIADDGGSAGEAQLDGAGAAPDRASAGGERSEPTGRPQGPTVGQLAKQAETAAARGDCAAVRAIASRIRKLDAAAHRSLAERNAAVKRCL